MTRVGARTRAAFLAEKAVGRPRLGQFLVDDLLGTAIGGGDEVARPLERHLQMLDLAEIALEAAPGAARGLDHDVEDGGMQHGGPVPVAGVRRKPAVFIGARNGIPSLTFPWSGEGDSARSAAGWG